MRSVVGLVGTMPIEPLIPSLLVLRDSSDHEHQAEDREHQPKHGFMVSQLRFPSEDACL